MGTNVAATTKELFNVEKPFAITMWEFSWIERRWAGAGYEDWDLALEELTARGYDAVRIDAFPHLMAADPSKEWILDPAWSVQDWGSPAINKITLRDDFPGFLRACRRHRVRVGLSSWFRQDAERTDMTITSPQGLAAIWVKTLDHIKAWGELDNVLYVDFCNEFPLHCWAPFYARHGGSEKWQSPEATQWMRETVQEFKKSYPQIPVTFSFAGGYDDPDADVGFLDFLEPHIWMMNSSEFAKDVGYNFARFDDSGYKNLALNGERTYKASKDFYDGCLIANIHKVAELSRRSGKPLVTTECWSVIDYKDWPLLHWDWILDLNALGVKTAAATGRWAGMATSNFCGPQFTGMWREKKWHQEMTAIIHRGKLV